MPGLLKSLLAFSGDGREVYFVGAREIDTAANEIYAVTAATAPRPVTAGPGFKTGPVAVPGGKYLIYTLAAAGPFPKPAAAEPAAKPGASNPPAGGGQAAAAGSQGQRGGGQPPAESGIAGYLVDYGPESNPAAGRTTVKETWVKIPGIALKKGEMLSVAVKAQNGRGIESWDWAKAAAQDK